MKRKVLLYLYVGAQLLFCSCHITNDKEIICREDFKKASDLAYNNPTKKSALDSSLKILNRCMQCDSTKTAAVELKMRLLFTLGKFKEGSDFIDSLQESDFAYPYKKKLYHDNFIAQNFASRKDMIDRDNTYRKMATDLEKHIYQDKLTSKEFQEAYTELDALPFNFADSTELNRRIDYLKIKYPNEVKFLDVFK